MLFAVIIFIFILGFLILVHEFGHFITAKKSGVKVEEFALGFPPRIFGKKIGETLYSINAIPIGGFVKLYGEEGTDPHHLADSKSFASKSLSTRALIISAGVIMNLLLASIIFYFLLGFGGFQSQQPLMFDYQFPFGQQQNSPLISLVAKDSPAEKSGLETSDIVISGNGTKFENSDQFITFIKGNKGNEVILKVKNLFTKEVKNINVIPRLDHPKEEGPLGVGLRDIAELKYVTLLEKTTVGFLHSFNLAHYSIVALGHFIKASFTEKTVEPLATAVVGPVGILAITKLTITMGFVALLNLLALISLALATVNILPFPALDGGKLALIGVEFLTKKRIPVGIERNINLAGFMLLILLLILVTYKDIIQFKEILF